MKLITKHNPFSNAFTLAEVLITLAIIGVVAAMTMPTLINNTNGAQFKTAYKKALSVLSQAVVMNIALDDYDLAGTSELAAETGEAPELGEGQTTYSSSLYRMFSDRTNGTLVTGDERDNYKAAINIKKDGTAPGDANEAELNDSNYVFRFNDGIIFTFDGARGNCTEANPCFGWIDANGTKGPNRSVSCTQDEDNECTSKVTINDIFPIKFYDQTVAPASAAARAVLYGSENEERTTEDQS